MSHLVVFDCEGTLTDSHAMTVMAMQSVFANQFGVTPDADKIREMIGLTIDEIMTTLAQHYQLSLHQDMIFSMAHDYEKKLLHARADDAIREKLFSGMKELLEKLATHHVCLAIITGRSRSGLDYMLDFHGLKHFFTVTHTANDGVAKPNPDMLKQTMREVGVSPAHTAMIGDTVFDIEMAVQAKAIPIGVGWGYHPQEALIRSGASFVADDTLSLYDYLTQIWKL